MAVLIRRGTPADVDAITDLTMRAYSKWLALIDYKPLPMLADYAVAIREHRFDSAMPTSGWKPAPTGHGWCIW